MSGGEMLVQSVEAGLAAPTDDVEGVLQPANREQEGDARESALGVGAVQAIEHALQRVGAAERADDREIEVTVAEARIAPVQQAGERAARGVVQ